MLSKLGSGLRPNSGHTILVVDDDPQVLKLFERILTRKGYTVIATGSGTYAREIINSRTVNLIVLDLSMPEPDGFELLKTLRKRKPPIPVLVVSGFMEGALLRASEVLGASASLSKTEAPKRLAEAVAELLR